MGNDDPIEVACVPTARAGAELLQRTPAKPSWVLLLAADTFRFSVDEMSDLASAALDADVAYVCTWGPDCERMHDAIDEVIAIRAVMENKTAEFHVMTTWHDDDTLADTLDFAFRSAMPVNDEASANPIPRRILVLGGVVPEFALLRAIEQQRVRIDPPSA